MSAITSELAACTVGTDAADPGCAEPLTKMVSFAYELDNAVRARPDAGIYGDIFETIDGMSDTSEGFADNRCFDGFKGGLTGNTVRDQNCTAYGMSLRLQWQTLTTQIGTAETRAGY